MLLLAACQPQPVPVTSPQPVPVLRVVPLSEATPEQKQELTTPADQEQATAPAAAETPATAETPLSADAATDRTAGSEVSNAIETILETEDASSADRPAADAASQKDGSSEADIRMTDSGTTETDQGGVVWSIDAGDTTGNAETKPAVIPEGADPSLASEALAAAFALIHRGKTASEQQPEQVTDVPAIAAKQPGSFRAAFLLPLSGPHKPLGRQIRLGAELAMFGLGNQRGDLVFIDSHGDATAAARKAIEAGADILLGPLFAETSRQVQPLAEAAGIPLLSLSNDRDILAADSAVSALAVSGGETGSWLLGQIPEQEVDAVLGYAIANLKPAAGSGRSQLKIGIVAEDSVFGLRLKTRAETQLAGFGMVASSVRVLSAETLADETKLRQAIRQFSGWQENQPVATAATFDAVMLLGATPFILRVAPLMAWYDLDPAKLRYLGTANWNQPAILQEPSLEKGLFAAIPASNSSKLNRFWNQVHGGQADQLAKLGFDAVSIALQLAGLPAEDRWRYLVANTGFAGFSGTFRLLPDGQNMRLFEIRQIDKGGSKLVQKAPRL